MIESARFTNVNGSFIDLNDSQIPFGEFQTEVDYRQSEKERAERHGAHIGYPYLGKRILRFNGDLLRDTSAEYWQKRIAMINCLMPRPHLGPQGKIVGRFDITLTGVEPLFCECSLDGYPELPIAALSPSAGKYMFALKAANPRLFGSALNTVRTNVPAASVTGRSFDKTYNFTYPGGSGQPEDIVITNLGNVEVFPSAYMLGPAESPALTLQRFDGEIFTVRFLNLILGAADYIEVDFEMRSALMNGDINVYDYTIGSDWWALEPRTNGVDNIVRFSSAAPIPGSYADIFWRNSYMI